MLRQKEDDKSKFFCKMSETSNEEFHTSHITEIIISSNYNLQIRNKYYQDHMGPQMLKHKSYLCLNILDVEQ